MANIVCKQMGYNSGEIYTFGHSSQLPTLPIVAGFRVCDGTEANIFACPAGDAIVDGDVDDPDCAAGCLGADGLQGTLDDTVDHACSHSIDQGGPTCAIAASTSALVRFRTVRFDSWPLAPSAQEPSVTTMTSPHKLLFLDAVAVERLEHATVTEPRPRFCSQ